MNDKLEKLRVFILNEFPIGVQMFNTHNIAGDYMITIYEADGVTIMYAPHYEYVEVFGLSYKEFVQLNEEVNTKC